MPTTITSPHNQRIKDTAKLEKRAERERRRATLVEGGREVSRALAAGVVPVEAFVCPELAGGADMQPALRQLDQLDRARRTALYTVTPEVFARLAVREESGGVVLVIPFLDTDLDHLPLRQPPFLVVVEGAEKPGNLGAILRTADAAGVDGVIACGGTDLHNPNVVRASLGTLFTVPVAAASTPETIQWLRRHGIRIVAATPDGAQLYTQAALRGPTAIVLGSEAHGLTADWLAAADDRVTIPMAGQADSLNLAASTAILLYEVVRQRNRLC